MTLIKTGFEGRRRKYDTGVFEKHMLSNGIPVWLQKSPIHVDDGGCLIAFLPGVGSQLDPQEGLGAAHFFEHLPFRGIKGKPSREAIEGPLGECGGSIAATTSNAWTRFEVVIPKEELLLGASTLYGFVQEPLLLDEDVAVEKGSIESEYRRAMSNSEKVAAILFRKHFFKGHKFADPVLGEPDTIKNISGSTLRQFHREYYSASNLQLICGGALGTHPSCLKILEETFGCTLAGTRVNLTNLGMLPIGKSGHVTASNSFCKRDMLRMGYGFSPANEKQRQALYFLLQACTLGKDSPLRMELREKRGLVYEFSFFCKEWNGLWEVGFWCPALKEKFSLSEEIFRDVLGKLSLERFLQTQRRRQMMRALSFEHPGDSCLQNVNSICVRGAPMSNWEDEAEEDSIEIEDVLAWRDRLLSTDPFVLEIHATP